MEYMDHRNNIIFKDTRVDVEKVFYMDTNKHGCDVEKVFYMDTNKHGCV